MSATVETVVAAIGAFQNDPSQANLDMIAQQVQSAHDSLSGIRDDQTGDFSHNGDPGFEMLGALNDLKNAMGALVSCAGNPSAVIRMGGSLRG